MLTNPFAPSYDPHAGPQPRTGGNATDWQVAAAGSWDDPELEPDYSAPHPSGIAARTTEPWVMTATGFDGVPIRALTLGLVAVFPKSGPVVPEDSGWQHTEDSQWCAHPSFTDHRLLDDQGRDAWLLVQRFRSLPNVSEFFEAARSVFGTQKPVKMIGMPARFRLPLRSWNCGDFGRHRGAPVPYTPIREFMIDGVRCTARLSWTTIPNELPQIWTEVFVGDTKTVVGNERSMLYALDASRAVATEHTNADRFVVNVISQLINDAKGVCQELDLVPDWKDRSRHLKIATLRAAGRSIVADVQMPFPGMTPRFAALPCAPYVQPVIDDRQMSAVVSRAAQEECHDID